MAGEKPDVLMVGARKPVMMKGFEGKANLHHWLDLKDKDAFVKEGVGHFASGWVWLAAEGETLKVLSTHDAEDLLVHRGLTPLLVCDLWEHAYYLDHKNDRKAFLEAWFDALPNWSFAQAQYDAARGQGEIWKHPPPIGSSQGTVALGAR